MTASLTRRALAAVGEFGRLTGWLCWSVTPPVDWLTAAPPQCLPEAGPAPARSLTHREHRAWARLIRQLTLPSDLAEAWERVGQE